MRISICSISTRMIRSFNLIIQSTMRGNNFKALLIQVKDKLFNSFLLSYYTHDQAFPLI